MSSSVASEQQSKTSKDIPVRKVVVNDPNQLPLDYGTTPGGTIFSTTPGGKNVKPLCNIDVIKTRHLTQLYQLW